jgi:hypothetical protein
MLRALRTVHNGCRLRSLSTAVGPPWHGDRMSERATIYIGGPLNGTVADLVNGHWHPYRDDNGQDLDNGYENLEMTRKPAKERRNYYLAGLPGGDWGYVHLSLWDDYCGARPWLDAHDAALVAFADAGGTATG